MREIPVVHEFCPCGNGLLDTEHGFIGHGIDAHGELCGARCVYLYMRYFAAGRVGVAEGTAMKIKRELLPSSCLPMT